MAFSFAVKLLAFASTAQANEVAKIPTDALAGEPAPSATTLQQRNLQGRWYNPYNNCDQPYLSAYDICCHEWQCPSQYECSYGGDAFYSDLRCRPNPSSYGYSKSYGIAANDYGLALTGGMGFSTLVVTIGFLMDLPKKWTKGDYVQLTAILLQISSAIGTFLFVTDLVTIFRQYRDLVWISAIAYLLSEPILILGMKMKSYSHRPSPKARRVKLIGAGEGFFLTLLFTSARYVTVKDVNGPLATII